MAIRPILLDTNAYAAFKRNVPEAVEILQHVPLIYLNSIVLGELFSGFAVGTREVINRQEFNLFTATSRIRLVNLNENTANHYARIYLALRKKGRPIPTNDMWIAASALQHDLAIFTYDAHFQSVDGLVSGHDLLAFVI